MISLNLILDIRPRGFIDSSLNQENLDMQIHQTTL